MNLLYYYIINSLKLVKLGHWLLDSGKTSKDIINTGKYMFNISKKITINESILCFNECWV